MDALDNVAVLIPAWNEEKTVEKVIKDFKKELPQAEIYVFNNNSTDLTKQNAINAGAKVIDVHEQGKGNVIRAMFRYIDADFYVLVDADDTYLSKDVKQLLYIARNGFADMVTGNRHASDAYTKENKRKFHEFGNNLVTFLINKLFSSKLNDILTGYRVFNKIFVKSFPVTCEGFEIETHLTLHALSKNFSIAEVPIGYQDRPEGSVSKLNTYRDGMRVIKTILNVFKNYKPLIFFTSFSIFFALLGVTFGIQPITEYLKYSYVYKIPTAILAASLEIIAISSLVCGIILHTIIALHKENFESNLNMIYKIHKEA